MFKVVACRHLLVLQSKKTIALALRAKKWFPFTCLFALQAKRWMLVYVLLALAAAYGFIEFPVRTDVDVQLFCLFSRGCHIFMGSVVHILLRVYVCAFTFVVIYCCLLLKLVLLVLWPAKSALV